MPKRPFVTAVAILLGALMASAHAQVPSVGLPKEKQTKLGKYLSAHDAAALLRLDREKIAFIDVRTRGEVQFVGVPDGLDAHVPYADLNEFGDWDTEAGRYKVDLNSNFAPHLGVAVGRKGLGKNDRIILICRSGDRSARAVNLLADLGYTNVYSVIDGFEGDLGKDGRRSVNGWKNAGLPWGYKLDKSQAYLPAR
jgi:rhodanese-related sulfurtransferase